jgi:hypothetical protein
MTPITEGTYAHRFQGSALNKVNISHFLAGMGWMDITANGDHYDVVGRQESVTVPQSNPGGPVTKFVRNNQLTFEGPVKWDETKRLWTAEIVFKGKIDGKDIETTNRYVITKAGIEDQYWIMSVGSEINEGSGDFIPAEAVSGDVRLIQRKST